MSTRSKNTIDKKVMPSCSKKRVENSWLLFARELLLDSEDITILSLPHPSTGDLAKYCIDSAQCKMYEIVTYDEEYRSWFIGETVKSDGKILLATPIHANFLVLPLLRKQCVNRAIPLEDLLTENYVKLNECVGSLEDIADLKGPPDVKAFKYNEGKTLQWLENRVRKVADILKHKNIHVTAGAISATFVTSLKDSHSIDDEFYLRYAHSLVSEYVTEDLSELLKQRLSFNPELVEVLAKKRKSEADQENIKKMKIDIKEEQKENESLENNTVVVSKPEPVKQTTKQKNLSKAASGSKTISHFFTKK